MRGVTKYLAGSKVPTDVSPRLPFADSSRQSGAIDTIPASEFWLGGEMHKHDPVRQISFIQQALSQNRKPIGFFLGAGCPLSIRVNEREEDGKTVTDPLIWDVAGLTKVIAEQLSSKDVANPSTWDKIVKIVTDDGGDGRNIELLLSRIRVFASESPRLSWRPVGLS